jgi:hypothetical protein
MHFFEEQGVNIPHSWIHNEQVSPNIQTVKNSICASCNKTEFIDFYFQFHKHAS